MTREEYIKTVFEHYKLVAVLADKNDCRTMRLRHRTTDCDVVLHAFPQHVEAYDILCDVSHENLPLILDAIDLDDGQIVWEEWINGITVAEAMECGRYRVRGAKKVMRAVCAALTVLHGYGIIHRDLKPENVMIDKRGRVVLIDFNVSRRINDAARDTVVMGTVGYASPEQMGVSQSDTRTDIYAAGVLLNVMVTGRHPSEMLAPGKVGRIVRRCTMISPRDRYSSAEKLRRVL